MSALAVAALTLRARRRRMLALVAFGFLFLAAGLTARVLTGAGSGHVELDRLFEVGGYPLVSTLLLLGWLLGRFGMIAALVMLAGIFSSDRHAGHARLFAVRPVSGIRLYLVRFAVLAGAAFALTAALMPAFDVLMLGHWAGPATFVLIAAYVIVYAGLTALLSVWTRADVWIALVLAITAMVWDALRRADALPIAAGARDFVGVLLPPQAALFQIETAFAQSQPVPWGAFTYAVVYGFVMLALAAVSITQREL